MSAHLLDGKGLAREIRTGLKSEFSRLAHEGQSAPRLAVLQIGADDSAAGYARAIERTCARADVSFHHQILSDDVSQEKAANALARLSADATVHGIMVLEPLPEGIDAPRLLEQLDPAKDIDGVHPENAGRLSQQASPYFIPATPAGAIRLLEAENEPFQGRRAVVIGRSDIVGKPMALLLLHRHCTVTLAHSRTRDLPALAREAEILCVAVGRPEMVKGEWIRPGATVVDFGTTYTDEGLKGDCEQESVAAVAGRMTPVPGGIGPMTNAMLLQNLMDAYRRQAGAEY